MQHTADDSSSANTILSESSREHIRSYYARSEHSVVSALTESLALDDSQLDEIHASAAGLVKSIRASNKPTIMESFLSEYGLSTPEGVGLMCLAEALLRVPDATTIDELIADKLESSDWAAHLGQSSSPLVNASTWALLLSGRMLDDKENPTRSLKSLLKRVGEPILRTAVAQSMKLLGTQFVLGQTIDEAIKAARQLESRGYTYSYDMLGEAAYTFDDADRYTHAYTHSIKQLSRVAGNSVQDKPGISVKLSALHPRYEYSHKEQVMSELVPRVTELAILAADAGIGFNIDAEEADRLDLSLDVIEALMNNPQLQQWHGFGIVVQAYSRRAMPVINWLLACARQNNTKIMIRLVKGAYWDSEIKQAQELGLASFPVFTQKVNTDVSYLACAQQLLANREVVYPQFATHNAHTVSAIRFMAGNNTDDYEFQRLHGMGESLHELLHSQYQTRCRIYAPVGAHRDLLAYLVRRLLENGANSSFVNQIVDHQISPSDVARCPVRAVQNSDNAEHSKILHPSKLYQPERENSKGYRTNDPASVAPLLLARERYINKQWSACSLIADIQSDKPTEAVTSPNLRTEIVGHVAQASSEQVEHAITVAHAYVNAWASTPVSVRASALQKCADSFEEDIAEFCAILCREAGKTLDDAISEVREAVDFLRYYAVEALKLDAQSDKQEIPGKSHGVVACISPWNFPLAIFTGQIAGALVGGNVVLAKPAEQTPLVAAKAITLLHAAGIPEQAVQLLLGTGATVGRQLSNDKRIDGVCFTGSTATSRLIERGLSSRSVQDVNNGAHPNPFLMAETGGLNAMIVDSSALTEQVVRDTIASAFQSAGQRCSALRILYIQKEAEKRLLTMLKGAMDALVLGDPWELSTDVGPVIDDSAYTSISEYINEKRQAGCVIHQTTSAAKAGWIEPTLIKVSGIEDMESEIFGPVLHIATFDIKHLHQVVNDINARGYGLTFGLHTRIDDRVQQIVETIHAGNVYVNRNQIGAVVGSQPFGGEGLSGTGPKAGGPLYVPRLMNKPAADQVLPDITNTISTGLVLPGPTGESNHWSCVPRSCILLIVQSQDDTNPQAAAIKHTASILGCEIVELTEEAVNGSLLKIVEKHNVSLVAYASDDQLKLLSYRQQLSCGDGPLIGLITDAREPSRFLLERHVCIDTTAAGGNASLLGSVD